METVRDLVALFRADSALRKLCGNRISQNQAEAGTVCQVDRSNGGAPAFFTITRRSAEREDVLCAEDRNVDPDEESFDVEIASSYPSTTEQIAERITALLDGRGDLVFDGREAQVVEVTEQDEGFVSREELIALGYDVASLRIGIYY